MRTNRQAKSPTVRLAVAILATALVAVAFISRYALLTVLLDAAAAAAVLGPFALAGLWLVPVFRLGPLPLPWQFLLGATLGIGAGCILVLLLGLGGLLYRPLWIGIMALLTAAGLIRARRLLNLPRDATIAASASRWLWLVLAPFLALAMLAAAHAPGFLWAEEGFGYDVLEYHLQLPKEYWQAGCITYVPHNVYANFPANVEMLYLLAMVLQGDAVDAGTTAQMIHLLLGVLTVAAVWVIVRDWSPHAVLGPVVAGSTGWFVYLSGLAYVEHGMLLFGMTAAGALLRGFSPRHGSDEPHAEPDAARRSLAWFAVAGALAGLARGCKYTAIPLIAVPLAIAGLVTDRAAWRRRLGRALCFATVAIGVFGPWAVKNLTMTGNPVFPLANELFHVKQPGWNEELQARWDRGHAPADDQRAIGARLRSLWRYVPADRDQRYGPAILLIGVIGMAIRPRDGIDFALLLVLVMQLAIWLFATHLYARFAVVILIPLALLAGRAVLGATAARLWLFSLLAVAGAVWSFVFTLRLYLNEGPGDAPASLIYDGVLSRDAYLKVVNHQLPADAHLLLVGDARAFYFQRAVDYCVVFNANPFVEAVCTADSDLEIIQWLQRRGYTHVLVHWTEIERLRASRYGFPEDVNRELFARLQDVGLVRQRDFPHPRDLLDERNLPRPRDARPYVTLYQVPPAGGPSAGAAAGSGAGSRT